MAAPIDQFALARKRAQQQANVASQTQKGALERRFATLGSLDSGARLKMEAQVDEQTNRQLSDANEGINAQEMQEQQRQREIAEGRKFATSEREGSQSFAAGEATKGRDFATSERVGGQNFAQGERKDSQLFASGEALKGRTFQTSEREGGQNFASGEALKGRDFATLERRESQNFAQAERRQGQTWQGREAAKGRQFAEDQAGLDRTESGRRFDQQINMQKDQFEKTFGEEQAVNEANIAFNRQMLGDESAIPELYERRYKRPYGSSGAPLPTTQDPYTMSTANGF